MDAQPAPSKRFLRNKTPAEVSPSPISNNRSSYQQNISPSAATPKVTVCNSRNAPNTVPASSSRGIAKKRKAEEEKTPEEATGQLQLEDSPPFKRISPAELSTLLCTAPPNNYQVTNRQYILIDTRDSANFNKYRVKSDHFVRFPLNCNAASIGESVVEKEEFASKSAVIKYFLKIQPNLLVVLQAPGFYDRIVVLDEDGGEPSSNLVTLMEALVKWNEGTLTTIHILEGGVQAFSKQYPQKSVLGVKVEVTPVIPAISSTPETSFKNLDEMITTSGALIKLATKFRSLSKALSILRESELENRKEAVIPDAFKCPVCKELFSGTVLQCEKGHSVCSGCHLKYCGECEAPISGNIRNWALEKALATVVSLKCVCGEGVEATQLEDHFEECVRKGEEFKRIQELISIMDRKNLAIDDSLNLAREEVFRNYLLRDMLLNYAVRQDSGKLCGSNVSSVRHVQKSWLDSVTKVLQKSKEPLFHMVLTKDNSLIENVGDDGKLLDRFLNALSTNTKSSPPTFSVKIFKEVFVQENHSSLSKMLVHFGGGLVQLDMHIPQSGGNLYLVFPTFALQSLRKLSITISILELLV